MTRCGAGRPTLHVVAGEGMAILAGDGLLTHAFYLLPASRVPKMPELISRKLEVIQILSAAAGPIGMVGGQAIDLACVKPDPQGHCAAARREGPRQSCTARRQAR